MRKVELIRFESGEAKDQGRDAGHLIGTYKDSERFIAAVTKHIELGRLGLLAYYDEESGDEFPTFNEVLKRVFNFNSTDMLEVAGMFR